MSLGQDLEQSLQEGRCQSTGAGSQAEADVVELDRLGVRLDRLKVQGASVGVGEAVQRLPDAFRSLPERIQPVEVATELGGAVFRSAPEDIRAREFFEVRTDGQGAELERWKVGTEGRERIPFTLTRDQLRRVVEDVSEVFKSDTSV